MSAQTEDRQAPLVAAGHGGRWCCWLAGRHHRAGLVDAGRRSRANGAGDLLGEQSVLLVLMWCVGWSASPGRSHACARSHWVNPPVQLAEEAQVVLKHRCGAHPAAQGQRGNRRRWRACSTSWWRSAKRCGSEMDARVQEASRRHRAGKIAAGRADVRAHAERGGVQPRWPHPALQQPRAHAVSGAVASARVAGGAELIGLGRSIYAVFDRKLVAHALDNIRQRMHAGAAQPSAQFVTTTPAGQLLRVQMAPVRAAQAQSAEDAADRRAHRLRAHARQHHARVRGRIGQRPGAAHAHRRQPLGAGQHAGGHRHAGLPRSGARHARALPGRGARRDAVAEPAHRGAGSGLAHNLEDRAGRWKTCWAPTW